MTVRRKIPVSRNGDGRIDLSQELKTVRTTISNLQELDMNQEPTAAAPAAETPAPKKVTKKPAKKAVKKVAKKVTKKVVKKVANGNLITLAQLCKTAKVEPRTARRRLRDAKIKNPGRWSWPKGAVPKGVQAALKGSD